MGYPVFNVWNPTASPNCSFDVTARENHDPARSGRELAQACLRAWGMKATATEVRVRRVRSSYFTDYADSEDWRDRWPSVWGVDLPETTDAEWALPSEYGLFQEVGDGIETLGLDETRLASSD